VLLLTNSDQLSAISFQLFNGRVLVCRQAAKKERSRLKLKTNSREQRADSRRESFSPELSDQPSAISFSTPGACVAKYDG
jgi:hypothetical protein